jgi:RNA polymerase primary sigma factor
MHEDLNIPPLSAALSHGVLTVTEEHALATRSAAGDTAARDALVCHNLRLVAQRANAFAGRGVPLADLFQEGVCGLVRAAQKFDPSRELRFSTYAVWWIRFGLQEAVRTAQPVVLPRPVEARRRRVVAVLGGGEPDLAAVAAATGLAPGHAAQGVALARLQQPLSIEADPVGHEDRTAPPIDEQVCAALRRRDAARMLDGCESFTGAVLRLRFGFDDGVDRTFAEVAAAIGSNRETVRLVERRALAELSTSARAEALRDAC